MCVRRCPANRRRPVEKPKCGKCGSNFVYIRRRDRQIICRRCGAETGLDSGKKEAR